MSRIGPHTTNGVLPEGRYNALSFRTSPPEIIGLNDVEPMQFIWWGRGGTVPDIGRSPSESTGKPKPNLPGVPSTGGGPTTGR